VDTDFVVIGDSLSLQKKDILSFFRDGKSLSVETPDGDYLITFEALEMSLTAFRALAKEMKNNN
jgi:hypothetical protein